MPLMICRRAGRCSLCVRAAHCRPDDTYERTTDLMTTETSATTTTGDVVNRDRLYINGAWVPSSGKGAIDVTNSTTEAVMGRIPEGTPEDVDRAVQAAREAFPAWSQTPVAERAAYLQRI